MVSKNGDVLSQLNLGVGGSVSITETGITTTAPDGSQTYIQNGVVGTRKATGETNVIIDREGIYTTTKEEK